jgi:hypothetical protein
MTNKIKILFLAADPKNYGRLRLGEECSRIESEIKLRSNQGSIEVISKWAVTTRELLWAIDKHKPDIVHFSGHAGEDGIVLEDESRKGHTVPIGALAKLFGMFKDNVRLVFLNACSTRGTAQAFKQTIDFTIGLKEEVGDAAAITFASTFYGGLSSGHSVEQAFKMSETLLGLDASSDEDNYMLFVRQGVDRSKPFINLGTYSPQSSKNGRAVRGPTMASGRKISEPQVCLWVHGWVKRLYDSLPTIELDWTKHFGREPREIPAQEVWDTTLFDELRLAKNRLDKRDKAAFIDFRGKLPLTALLAIGSKFPEVGGYRFRAEQPIRSKTVLWRSDVTASKRRFKIVSEKNRSDGSGQDVLVALSITGGAKKEVTALYDQQPEIFSAMIYVEPDNGTGDGALSSDKDAVALSIHAKDLIRDCKVENEASQVHLVVYAPAAYCLFLGQRLNALGKIVTYERVLNGGYKRSVTIQTG